MLDTEVTVAKIDVTQMKMFRKVDAQAYRLGVAEQAAFENASVDVVFSEAFLLHLRTKLHRTVGKIQNPAERIRNMFVGTPVHTMRDLLALSEPQLFEMRGLGPSSCALIYDVLALFGYKLKVESPPGKGTYIDRAPAALILIQMLGID